MQARLAASESTTRDTDARNFRATTQFGLGTGSTPYTCYNVTIWRSRHNAITLQNGWGFWRQSLQDCHSVTHVSRAPAVLLTPPAGPAGRGWVRGRVSRHQRRLALTLPLPPFSPHAGRRSPARADPRQVCGSDSPWRERLW